MLQKSTSWLRWPVLVLACLMLIGSYYCFDIPAAIKTQIDDYFGDPSDYETYFSLLYTLYAAPNVILPFFGGFFVDRFGVRICLLVFTSLIAVGQILFAFGISIKSWPLIFVGRLVFGFGGESLSVANTALVAQWFYGKELAFAFGINLAVAKLGSVINNITSPALASSDGVIFACWFGAILCAMSVSTVLVVSPIDKWMDQQIADEARKDSDAELKAALLVDKIHPDDPDAQPNAAESNANESVSIRDITKFGLIFWVLSLSCVVVYGAVIPFNNISSSLLLERDYFMVPPSNCALANPYQCQSDSNLPVNCPSSQWYQPPLPMGSESQLLVTACGNYTEALTSTIVDCTDTCWSDGCAVQYCKRLDDGEKQAAVIMSIPYIISAVMSPVLGLLVDRYGCRAIIATIAPALLVIVHFLLGYSKVGPIGPLVGQGLAYTGFAAVLWPAVPLVISPHLIGLGFGIVTSMQNLSCAIIPLIAAALFSDSDDKYIPNVELLFGCLGIVGFIVGLYMNYYDYYYNNNLLNRGASEENDAGPPGKGSSFDDHSHNPIHPKTESAPRTVSSGLVPTKEGLYSPAPIIASSPDDNAARTFSGAGLQSGSAGMGATVIHNSNKTADRLNMRSRSRSRSTSRDVSLDRTASNDKRRDAAIFALNKNA